MPPASYGSTAPAGEYSEGEDRKNQLILSHVMVILVLSLLGMVTLKAQVRVIPAGHGPYNQVQTVQPTAVRSRAVF